MLSTMADARQGRLGTTAAAFSAVLRNADLRRVQLALLGEHDSLHAAAQPELGLAYTRATCVERFSPIERSGVWMIRTWHCA